MDKKISNQGNLYVCPKSRMRECPFREDVDEIRYETGFKKCHKCGCDLIFNWQNTLNNEVERGCRRVLNDLKADMEALKRYRIPPQFFGPAAGQASKCLYDDKF